ncbi:hypothetical protein M758_8G131800 [Ceratodon purpureus]|nr:hypothetical protein M758_8G131800 [Ceratodon purpureus]
MKINRGCGALVLLLLCNPALFPGVDSQGHVFQDWDFYGLQKLWAAWNTTPNPEINLENWMTWNYPDGPIPWPCYASTGGWQGVRCLRYQFNETEWNTWVVGLQLSNAELVGVIPPEITNIDKLTTLTLTGNPNLTGPIPPQLMDLALNILDLHDNGLNGTLENITWISQASTTGYFPLVELDLSGNKFTGGFPNFPGSVQLRSLILARNQLEGTIKSDVFQNMTTIRTLDISDNRFTGPVPALDFFRNLNILNLSTNLFTGLSPLPPFISKLPPTLTLLDLSGLDIGGSFPDWSSIKNLSVLSELYLDKTNISSTLNLPALFPSGQNRTLNVLSLKNNTITTVVSNYDLIEAAGLKIYLQGNPYCTDNPYSLDDARRCYCEQICRKTPKLPTNSINWKVIVISTTIPSALLIGVILIFALVLHRNRKYMRSLLRKINEADISAKRFEFNELRTATRNFAEDMKLGAGAYGAVYKGILPNNLVVAVKQLFLETSEGRDNFVNEVLLISNLQHRNLVTLKGYCLHGKQTLLVYEYVDNDDLDKLLLSKPVTTSQPMNPAISVRTNHALIFLGSFFCVYRSTQLRTGSELASPDERVPGCGTGLVLSACIIPVSNHSSRYQGQQHLVGPKPAPEDCRFWAGTSDQRQAKRHHDTTMCWNTWLFSSGVHVAWRTERESRRLQFWCFASGDCEWEEEQRPHNA